jgi:hypothetical protein
MNRNTFIYGFALGVILCGNIVYTVQLCYRHSDFENSEVIGYAVMSIANSLVFFGILNYRKNQPDQAISLGKAFQTGAIIALLASTMYVVFWLFYYYLVVPDFMEVYIPHALQEAVKNGASASELASKTKELENFRLWYKNPLFVILMTYFEVLPIELIVACISSLILKRKAS